MADKINESASSATEIVLRHFSSFHFNTTSVGLVLSSTGAAAETDGGMATAAAAAAAGSDAEMMARGSSALDVTSTSVGAADQSQFTSTSDLFLTVGSNVLRAVFTALVDGHRGIDDATNQNSTFGWPSTTTATVADTVHQAGGGTVSGWSTPASSSTVTSSGWQTSIAPSFSTTSTTAATAESTPAVVREGGGGQESREGDNFKELVYLVVIVVVYASVLVAFFILRYRRRCTGGGSDDDGDWVGDLTADDDGGRNYFHSYWHNRNEMTERQRLLDAINVQNISSVKDGHLVDRLPEQVV